MRKGIASKADGPIVSGRKSSSPTGAALVRKHKVPGHSGIDQHKGLGHIGPGTTSHTNMTGAKLVRHGKAPGVDTAKPRRGTVGTSPGPMSKAFAGPDRGQGDKVKGSMKGGRPWRPHA